MWIYIHVNVNLHLLSPRSSFLSVERSIQEFHAEIQEDTGAAAAAQSRVRAKTAEGRRRGAGTTWCGGSDDPAHCAPCGTHSRGGVSAFSRQGRAARDDNPGNSGAAGRADEGGSGAKGGRADSAAGLRR